MIGFNYETGFKLKDEPGTRQWLLIVAEKEGFGIETVNYIFCSDPYLHDLNLKYLDHDTLTDVIGFDYSIGKNLQGDIFISVDRVKENAKDFEVDFEYELSRVMVHGLLHFCGWSDKTDSERDEMRKREDYHLNNLTSV